METRPAPFPVRDVLENDLDKVDPKDTSKTPQEPPIGKPDGAGHLDLHMT